MLTLRSTCASLALLSAFTFAFAQAPTGSWQPLNNQPTFVTAGLTIPLLLTDGSVMVQDNGNYASTNHWYKLTPDAFGSYVNGTWTQLADAPDNYAPLYYASAVLADGRVIVIGGEANYQNYVWTNLGAIYDPVANTWTPISAPPGWDHVGDAQCCVLPDGRFMLASSWYGDFTGTQIVAAVLDPTTMAWSPIDVSTKVENNFDEEGWTLMPDGTILTVDVENLPYAEKYVPSLNTWVSAGQTPQNLSSPDVGEEIGPAVLRFDGTVFQLGGTPHSAIYHPGATPTDPGEWTAGPDLPDGLDSTDGPACLLPNGNVLMAVSPGFFDIPVSWFEFDGTNLNAAPNTPNSPSETSFFDNLLVLPNGQVMQTDCSSDVEIYTPSGGPQDAWRPTITNAPAMVLPSSDNFIRGTQFNGLSQTNAYGDDWSNASNYPIIRITNNATGHVFYCRTHDHSTMGVATGSQIVSTFFAVPANIELGSSKLEVVANGIPSAKSDVYVGYEWSGFLSPLPKQAVKLGSTVPIKFQLTGASAGITNFSAQGYWAAVPNGQPHLIGTFTLNNGVWQLNLKTTPLGTGTFTITVRFPDGSTHDATLVVKK